MFKNESRASHIKLTKKDGPKILPDACSILLGRKGWLTFLPYIPQSIMLKCKDVSAKQCYQCIWRVYILNRVLLISCTCVTTGKKCILFKTFEAKVVHRENLRRAR
jgi:hypothetical protein